MSAYGQRKSKLLALQKLRSTPKNVPSANKRLKSSKSDFCSVNKSKAISKPISLSSFPKITKKCHISEELEASVGGSLLKAEKVTKDLQPKPLSTDEISPSKSHCPRYVPVYPSAVPSKIKLQQQWAANLNEGNLKVKWSEGHMLWAKIRGYPYWPCMITADPFSKLFCKASGSYKNSRAYHVQFFGAGTERSWINEASLLEYEGREKFLDVVQYGLENPGKSCKPSSEFQINTAWYPAWSLAVAEAEGAYKLSLEDRKSQYTFRYMLVKGNQQMSLDKVVEIWKHSSGQLQSFEDSSSSDDDFYNDMFHEQRERPWYDSDDFYSSDDSLSEEGKASRQPVKVKVRQGLFEVYCAKHTRFVKEEHPTWDEFQISQQLWLEWSLMSNIQRSQYVSHHQKPVIMKMTKTKQVTENTEDAEDLNPYKLDLEVVKLSDTCLGCLAENLCAGCDKIGIDLISCTGTCGKYFHSSCVEGKEQGGLLCSECTSGVYICFACKKADSDIKYCSHQDCTRCYHVECIGELKLTLWDKSGFVCPLHTCRTCAIESNPRAREGIFLQCLMCPTAYHASDFCVAAGSQILRSRSLICPSHFKPIKSQSQHARVNVKRCLDCGNADNLLLCVVCPAAYHEGCDFGGSSKSHIIKRVCPAISVDFRLMKKGIEREPWLCGDCVQGKRPLYGDIVWIKYGFYRWWPGEVCHPSHVPEKVKTKVHKVGEFPVRFFGSQDFAWVHQGRIYQFDKNKSSRKQACLTTWDKDFTQGLKEAAAAYRLHATIKDIRSQQLAKIAEDKASSTC